MSAQVAPRLCAPFSYNGSINTSTNVRNKKRKGDFHLKFQSSPNKSIKLENISENTHHSGKPIAPIAPIQNKTPTEYENLSFHSFSVSTDILSKTTPKNSVKDMDLQNSLLRSTLLSQVEQGKGDSSSSSSSGQKFINPKKEFIVKHNKDTIDLKNNDIKFNEMSYDGNRNDSYASSSINMDFVTDCKYTVEEMKSHVKLEEPQDLKVMSNMEFWKYLLTLQVLMQQASVQLKNMVTKPVEELVSHSLKLVELKNELEPHLGLLENSLRTILNVLPHVEYVEIGSPENTFKVSQQAWEKAYSKTTIKDSALAFLECDLFIPKQTKLSSTAGRSSNSAINGTLKPIDSRILNALYYTLADRKRMPNIQRTQDNYLASPHFLTAKEQKLVRETLAQYFNQLRQKEKRRSHLNHSIKKEDESY